jgi:hypothetical protein
MTNPADQERAAKDRKPEVPPTRPDTGEDLEAEIVRDLEVSEQADDVRGGACPRSKPV